MSYRHYTEVYRSSRQPHTRGQSIGITVYSHYDLGTVCGVFRAACAPGLPSRSSENY